MLISTTMESIGVMVYHRIVPYSVVKDLIGTSTTILWRRLQPWIGDMRSNLDNPAAFEWFEWLANKLEDLGCCEQPPAYEAHRSWKPRQNTREI